MGAAASSSRTNSRASSRAGSEILPSVLVVGRHAGTTAETVPVGGSMPGSRGGSIASQAGNSARKQEGRLIGEGDEAGEGGEVNLAEAEDLVRMDGEEGGEEGGRGRAGPVGGGGGGGGEIGAGIDQGGEGSRAVVAPVAVLSPRTAFAANPVEWVPPTFMDDDDGEDGDEEDKVWEWAEDDDGEEGDAELNEAQDLISGIRGAAREHGVVELDLQLEENSVGGKLGCDDFCKALAGWKVLKKKKGLVERAGPSLFDAIAKGREMIETVEASDFLSVNSRGNPLRAATAQRKGTTGGKLKEMERKETAARNEIERMVSARSFLAAELTEAKVKEDKLGAELRSLAQRYKELSEGGVTAQEGPGEGGEEGADKGATLKAVEKEAVELRKTLALGQAATIEAQREVDANEERLEGIRLWHDFLVLELEEEKSFIVNREMGLREMERELRKKSEERQALREEAWAKGSRNPERWAVSVKSVPESRGDKRGEDEDEYGDEDEESSERVGGGLLRMISESRAEMMAMYGLLLPHAIAAFRKVEISDSEKGEKLGETKKRLEKLMHVEEEKGEVEAKLAASQEEVRSLNEEVEMLRARIKKMDVEAGELEDDKRELVEKLAKSGAEVKEAERQRKEAVERLAITDGQMSSLNTEIVSKRTEAFHAVQASKEARQLVEELDALRKREEHTWLAVQEEETKKKSMMLSIRINDFQNGKLGKQPFGPRVFVSSTQSDFVKERDEIWKFAMPTIQEECARRGKMMSVVDLRYGYGDGDVTVGRLMPMVLAEIDKCDYFTCFLGQQTGAFPQNFGTGVGGKKKGGGASKEFYTRSCTEMECDLILDSKLAWGQRAFFYIRDSRSLDDITAQIDVPLTEGMSDSLQALKQRIYSSGLKVVVDYMTARDGVTAWRDDVLMMVKEDYKLDPEEFDHIQNGIEGWRPRSFLEQMEDLGHDAAFENRIVSHVRTDATDAAVQAIREHVDLQGGNPLLLSGPPGSGKATAMAVFMDRYRRTISDEKVLIAGISTRTVRTNPVNLLRTMMRMIKTHFRVDTPGLPDGAAEVLSHGALFSWLEIGGLEGQVVLCLDLEGFCSDSFSQNVYSRDKKGKGGKNEKDREDGGDGHASGEGQQAWLGGDGSDLRWLTAAQPSGANLIVATSNPTTLKTARESYFWPEYAMQPLSRKDCEGIVERYLGSRGQELEGKRLDQFWSLRTQEVSLPLFLHLFINEWCVIDTVGWKHDPHIERALMIQAKEQSVSVSLLFKLLLDRWEEELEESGVSIFGPILSNIVISRAGLSEEDLLGLTGLRPAHLNIFISTMREFLSNKSGAINLTSHVLVQTVVTRYLVESSEVQGGRAAIIDYFKGKGFGVERACMELPYQMRLANQTDELEATIKVLGVFRCFSASGLETELMQYWSIFTSESKEIADGYMKTMNELEKEAAAGMPGSEQLPKYGVSLDGLDDMAELLSQLARFLSKTGQNLTCIKMLERLVDIQARLNPDSVKLASACHRLATQCWRIAYFEQGKPYAEQCLLLQEKLMGKDSLEVSDTNALLALTLFGLNQLEEAERCMYLSLKIREGCVGKDHPTVAEALLSMGKILLRQGKMEEARDYQLRANKLMGARTRKNIRTMKDSDMPVHAGEAQSGASQSGS